MAEDGGGGERMDVDGVSSGGPSSDQDLVNEVLLNISQMEIDGHKEEYRKNILFSSQLALNAKRHCDAIQVLKKISQLNFNLNEEEMDAIELAYNNYFSLIVSALNELDGYVDSGCLNSAKCYGLYDGDKLEDPEIKEKISTAAGEYIEYLEVFMLKQITRAVELFEDAILESRAVPTKAFYWKMIGDIYRICDEHKWKRGGSHNMGSLSGKAYEKAWLLVRYDVQDLVYIRNKVKKSYMLHPRAPNHYIDCSIYSSGVLVKESTVPYFECLDSSRLFDKLQNLNAKRERHADKGDEQIRVEESLWTTSMFPPPTMRLIVSTKNGDSYLFRLAMKLKRYDDALCVVPFLLYYRAKYDGAFMEMMENAYRNYYVSIKSVEEELQECKRTEEVAGRSCNVKLITDYMNHLEKLRTHSRTRNLIEAKREETKRISDEAKREAMKRKSDEAGESKEKRHRF